MATRDRQTSSVAILVYRSWLPHGPPTDSGVTELMLRTYTRSATAGQNPRPKKPTHLQAGGPPGRLSERS